jgi:hypothetical protein
MASEDAVVPWWPRLRRAFTWGWRAAAIGDTLHFLLAVALPFAAFFVAGFVAWLLHQGWPLVIIASVLVGLAAYLGAGLAISRHTRSEQAIPSAVLEVETRKRAEAEIRKLVERHFSDVPLTQLEREGLGKFLFLVGSDETARPPLRLTTATVDGQNQPLTFTMSLEPLSAYTIRSDGTVPTLRDVIKKRLEEVLIPIVRR